MNISDTPSATVKKRHEKKLLKDSLVKYFDARNKQGFENALKEYEDFWESEVFQASKFSEEDESNAMVSHFDDKARLSPSRSDAVDQVEHENSVKVITKEVEALKELFEATSKELVKNSVEVITKEIRALKELFEVKMKEVVQNLFNALHIKQHTLNQLETKNEQLKHINEQLKDALRRLIKVVPYETR